MIDAAFGTVSIEWRIKDDVFVADVVIPAGTTATFIAPVDADSRVACNGSPVVDREAVELVAGDHRIVVEHPLVAGDARTGR